MAYRGRCRGPEVRGPVFEYKGHAAEGGAPEKRPDGVGREMIDTTAPPHHNGDMRLTINLEPDLYAVAVSLAKAEDCSISAAVNQLLRRSLPGAGPRRGEPAHGMERRNGLLVCYGKQVVTAETVQSIEEEDGAA